MFARYRTQMLAFAAVTAVIAATTLVNQLAFQATGAEPDKRGRSSVDVRINARLTPNGHVEFALQRETGGVWGDRILPKSRFFSGDIDDARWRNSSRISLSLPNGSDPSMATDDGQTTSSSSRSQHDDRYHDDDDDDDDRYRDDDDYDDDRYRDDDDYDDDRYRDDDDYDDDRYRDDDDYDDDRYRDDD